MSTFRPLQTLRPRSKHAAAGFTLFETMIGLGIAVCGFVGAYGAVFHAAKLVSASEEDALASSALERRIDQLRSLEWPELTNGTGITTKLWTGRPETMAGITVSQESFAISPYDVATAKSLNAVWNGTSNPTLTFTAGSQNLNTAAAVKVVASLSWNGRRSNRQQTRKLVTVISRGGISSSDL